MLIKRLITSLFIISVISVAKPAYSIEPSVRNVRAEQNGDEAHIYYDLSGEGEFRVSIKLSSDGGSNEKPVHEVCVDDFYMGEHEVTQGEWKKVMGDNPSGFKDCGDDCPVEEVSWKEAQEFIERLNKKTGKIYRLSSEAEWEYAAREGGKKIKWAGTSSKNSLGEYAWYDGNSGNKTHPVKTKKPNGLGLYDMSGNVWEWVEDIYSSNPIYTESGSYRVFRGGGWRGDQWRLRAADRNGYTPGFGRNDLGFRLARTP